jgi:predicted transport protein
MNNLTYVKPEKVWLKEHPILNERWVQQIIADDPSILGLGDLVLKDKERIQPRAGRLDLLLQDAETNRRYEVEVQLGKTDESHIIRTIEYWDIERKRYPQYDHCAVIVAEDITSRFLNVVSLFNGFIPLIVVQMNAIKIGDQVSLVFTTVLDELPLGLVDEDEEIKEVTDRAYWEKHGTKATVGMADELLEIIKTFDKELELKYNKFYVGLAKNGQPNNFAVFRPQKNSLRLEPRLKREDEMEEKLEAAGLDVMDYDKKWGRYRIRLSKGDIKKHSEFLTNLLRSAYENSAE